MNTETKYLSAFFSSKVCGISQRNRYGFNCKSISTEGGEGTLGGIGFRSLEAVSWTSAGEAARSSPEP
jgi:hypothetical protein